jgi:hypothetical protein
MAPESAFNHFDLAKQKWEIHLDEPILLEPDLAGREYLIGRLNRSCENAIEDKMNQLLYMLDS